jgi:hypothetical protein
MRTQLTETPLARIGGPSSVFAAIRVRFSDGQYHAAAKWSDYRARASRNGYNVEAEGLTPSQAAVETAWLAHVRLFAKVCAAQPDEDAAWWAERLAEHTDRAQHVAVVDGDGVSGGGYVVGFMSPDSAHIDTDPCAYLRRGAAR